LTCSHARARSPVGQAAISAEVQAQVAHGPQHCVVLEQRAVLLRRGAQVLRSIHRSQPTPRHEVRAGCHRGCRVDLQQRQPFDNGHQVGRTVCVQQLRAYRHASGLRTVEVVDGHATSVVSSDDSTNVPKPPKSRGSHGQPTTGAATIAMEPSAGALCKRS
jgi:hypothetical protein